MKDGLRIRNLHKRFGDQHVVRGIDLRLAPGEIVALLGPSGCGKTTALRMIAGLERPDDGEIAIGDRDVFGPETDLAPEARRVGMVFQSYAVWPHMTVLDNVAYPLRFTDRAGAPSRAVDALRRVRLDAFRERFPSTLSGGQQQRVALARALAARPDLLLFDEPLSNLDAQLRQEMRHEIRSLIRQDGLTAVYVTHDQPEAFAVADRVAVVLDGKIAQDAPPAELYRTPDSLAVAHFVGRLCELGPVVVDEDRARLADRPIDPRSIPEHSSGPLVLAVRPEDVNLVTPEEGLLAGRVARTTFLGDRTEVEVETEAGSALADVSAHAAPDEGSTVGVRWAHARVYVKPTEDR